MDIPERISGLEEEIRKLEGNVWARRWHLTMILVALGVPICSTLLLAFLRPRFLLTKKRVLDRQKLLIATLVITAAVYAASFFYLK